MAQEQPSPTFLHIHVAHAPAPYPEWSAYRRCLDIDSEQLSNMIGGTMELVRRRRARCLGVATVVLVLLAITACSSGKVAVLAEVAPSSAEQSLTSSSSSGQQFGGVVATQVGLSW